MSAGNNLEKCLKGLEKIKRKALKRLVENCKSEYMRNSAIHEIQVNYVSAKRWIEKIYLAEEIRRLGLLKQGEHNKDILVEYLSEHLNYHLKQIRNLGQRRYL